VKLDTAQQGESICDSWSSSKRRRGLNKCATDGDKMSRVVHRKSVKRRVGEDRWRRCRTKVPKREATGAESCEWQARRPRPRKSEIPR